MASRLEELIGVPFNDERLLQRAFIHRSFLHEHPERIPGMTANERLEFLGDAVLNFISAAWLYANYPAHSEGDLTALRAALVKTSTLAGFARSLGLGTYIQISRGEDTPTSRNRASLLADVFEAVLGAVYLDQGLDGARAFILPFLERQIAAMLSGKAEVDYRTRLQEQAQAHYNQTPAYRMRAMRGPAHEREFTLEVFVGERLLGVGSGPNKQAAAQAAAKAALALFDGADSLPL